MAKTKTAPTRDECLKRLSESDHGYLTRQFAEECRTAFGIDAHPPVEKDVDTRYAFKGLTLYDADGYMNREEFSEWFDENVEYVVGKVPAKERPALRNKVWEMYVTPKAQGGEGLKGVPFAYGIDASTLAEWLCRSLGVDYAPMFGRGSQLRVCVKALRDWQSQQR